MSINRSVVFVLLLLSIILIYCWIFHNNILYYLFFHRFFHSHKTWFFFLVIINTRNTLQFVGVLFCKLQVFAPFCCTLWTKQNNLKSNRTKCLFNNIAKNEISKVFPYQKREKKNATSRQSTLITKEAAYGW